MTSPLSPDDDSLNEILTEKTCHILPCNIDESLMAPTHIFFKPVACDADGYNSTFRGRALSAHGKTCANLALLSQQTSNGHVRIKASVENVLEWNHEHDVETIRCKDVSESRIHIAKEWSELSEAVSS